MSAKKTGCLLLALLFLSVLFTAAAAEKEIPAALRVTQELVTVKMENNRIKTYSVLHSAREDVDAMVAARVAALMEEAEPLIPKGRSNRPARADVCAQVTRTGERWMSFHICANVSGANKQLWVRSEEYTFDMESGREIRLGGIIREDRWETLLAEIRRQVTALFPEEEPDAAALDALCRRESLEASGFVMAPGHLALYFPAGDVYPAHGDALLRVEIYVPELRSLLTDEAIAETDCTDYALVALTYDDGPGKGTTRGVLNSAAVWPGQVTFFMIGTRLEKNAELVHRAYEAGHSVQSHTWFHNTVSIRADRRARADERYAKTLGSLIGAVPVMMRPPGGQWQIYLKAGTELPMILWAVNSLDVTLGNTRADLEKSYNCAMAAEDGDIVLFHDMKTFAGELAEKCMKRFEEKNMLLVTVNDLLALRGVTPGTGDTVKSCPPLHEETTGEWKSNMR